MRLLALFVAQLRQVRDVQKSLVLAVRVTRAAFRAGDACIAMLRPDRESSEILAMVQRKADGWDLDLVSAFIREEHPVLPPDLVFAPIRRRGRSWAALALRRDEPFEPRETFRRVAQFTAALSEAIQRIDRERLFGIREQIDQKFQEQLRPQDLFYEILHGLRTLTRYDHSSALLIQDDGDEAFRLVAEQISWTKAKSRRIGRKFQPTESMRAIMAAGAVHGFRRDGDEWREWDGMPVTALAELLDYNQDEKEIREGSMIVAPLVTPAGLIGVMKIAGRHPPALSRYEALLLERFRSQAAMAIRNVRRTESLHTRMVEAEKKHAMADLARGVSHDVNNALGSVLPIVQEMQDDVRSGQIDLGVFARDLEQVQTSLQVCRRIFGGMLAFATRGARRTPEARLGPALEGPLAILRDGLNRRGIEVDITLDPDLPPVAGGLSDLEQLFLNLITNARESMPEGGTLRVSARGSDGTVEIAIEDTGCGIPAEHMSRIQEPFFTTKPEGNGLGLSICRSIVWEMAGKMSFESQEGRGTRVRIVLPAARPTGGERA